MNGLKQPKPGESYRQLVTLVKIKKGVPTVIQVSGRTYILRHEDTRPPRRQTFKNGPCSPDDIG